ncbi:MAG: C4-dicarboxylate ABC transporter substrate-binding protein [Thermoprotei archaeon]|nr:MAG: C4-dicarboxylate ABC transporter substrate-binding protein [Thermoprotei archaeon]
MFLKSGVSKAVIIGVVVVIIIIGVAAAFLLQKPPTKPLSIKIYTGGTGGTYYPLGTKLAELITKYSNGKIEATAVTSGASVANAKALDAGDAQVVFIQNDIAYYAHEGLYMFEGNKIEEIRGIATLYPEIIQIVVRADSGIKTLADLAGKKVVVGAQGSGTAVNAEQILKAAGLWDKITPVYADFKTGAQQLKLGQVDAVFYTAGIPTSAIVELSATTPVNLVEVPEDILKKLHDQGYAFYVKVTVPKDTYNGMTKDVTTVAVKAMLAVRADLPEDAVYTITKILFEHLDELKQAHKRAEAIKLEKALDGMSIPLHPGAEKYYKEKGVLS